MRPSFRAYYAAGRTSKSMNVGLALPLLAVTFGQGPGVPNFPTPEPAVEQMLDLAAVTRSDTLYDLGCGDGRIVIAAAKRGARGIGVDIDPNCVQQSKQNAALAGVSDRTNFAVQDLFKTDITNATVIALYLSPEMDVRLRPRLLHDLKPGTRVISHVYDMGDWQPDKTVPAHGSKKFNLFLWIVPANAAGDWRWTIRTESGLQSDTMHLVQRFQELSGALYFRGHALSLTASKLTGDHLTVSAASTDTKLTLDAAVSSRSMRGTAHVESAVAQHSYPFTATREP